MRQLDLTDPNPPRDQRNHPEKVKLLLTQGTDEHWGELEPFRETTWAAGVEKVSAEAMSNALHGYLLPLLRELGRDPRASARRISDDEGLCAIRDNCPIWKERLCKPGGRDKKNHGPPGCYQPPLSTGTDSTLIELFYTVSQAWKDQRHTVVVIGEGFNLK